MFIIYSNIKFTVKKEGLIMAKKKIIEELIKEGKEQGYLT